MFSCYATEKGLLKSRNNLQKVQPLALALFQFKLYQRYGIGKKIKLISVSFLSLQRSICTESDMYKALSKRGKEKGLATE